MWRQAICVRRLVLANTTLRQHFPSQIRVSSILPSYGFTNTTSVGVRSFSRRAPRGGLNDPDEELIEHSASEAERRLNKTPSATEMEFFSQLADDLDEEEEENERMDAEYQRKQEEIRKELDSRTGRGWSDPWHISEEQWMSLQTADDLPDWAPEFVSRISQERVQVYPEGIPTLSALASLSLPPAACPHPGLGQTKEYAAYRKEFHYRHIEKQAQELAKLKVDKILKLTTWDEKQDAVDEVFESVEEQLRAQEEILGLHPEFGSWVGRAVEEYLRKVQSGEIKDLVANSKKTDTESKDGEAVPLFMDCFDSSEADQMVPSILSPLKPHPRDGPGRMVEEWQLAAHKKTKRILMRPCTRTVAETLEKNDVSRIFVHGRKGVGKSAVLASIVASARKSGHVVMYLPDGDRLRKNGFFVTPNSARDGMYDLQDLSEEACAAFLASHGKDLEGMEADKATMETFFKESQLNRITEYSGESMGLVDLLKHAAERKSHAPSCFSVVVDALMNQTEKPFLMVLDEFNCYYDKGQYFHMTYDKDVREAIPHSKINLFEHALAAMALSTDAEEEGLEAPKLMKRGGIIVGVTESHAVPRKVTDGLAAYAKSQSVSSDDESLLTVVEVPRFSDLEVDHMLGNYEAIGLGNLRLDRGDTLMDEQEVAYLKMVSGSIGQRLLDVAVL